MKNDEAKPVFIPEIRIIYEAFYIVESKMNYL